MLTISLRPVKILVVIRYLDVVRIAIPPGEAHAELIVDPYAVLACAVAVQRLKLVAGGIRGSSNLRAE
jgi:hypothetical protein